MNQNANQIKYGLPEDSEFYKRPMKSWLKNDIEMYSAHNEGRSVIAARFV